MSTPPPPHEPQPPGYQYPAPGGPAPSPSSSVPPSPYGQPATDPYAQSAGPYTQGLGPSVTTPGGSPYLSGVPGAPKRGIKGWKAALLATGTGVAGLVIGIAIGNAGGGSEPVAMPTFEPDTAISGTDSDSEPADEPTATDTEPVADDDDDGDAPGGEEGTRANPFAIGTPVTDGDWDVVLGQPREGWTEIQAENQFNDPAPDGMEYYIVPVSATYIGEETGLPWIDLTVQFVGSDARTYTDRCGVIPDDLMDVDELYEGGVGDGNVCVTVPEGADGLWTLRTGWGDNAVFFDATE